jgi:hypothetical protein
VQDAEFVLARSGREHRHDGAHHGLVAVGDHDGSANMRDGQPDILMIAPVTRLPLEELVQWTIVEEGLSLATVRTGPAVT